MHHFVFTLLVLAVLHSTRAKVVEFTLKFSRGLQTPDGFQYPVILVNGEFPGPTLSLTAGDVAHVTVVSMMPMDEVISIHWHGVTSASVWMDGAGYITNCPLTSGATFKYVIPFQTEGTMWYHTHASDMRAVGSYGMVTVAPKMIPAEDAYDDTLTVILADWYHADLATINAGLVGHKNNFAWPGNGDSVLINGKGECKECPATTSGSKTTITYPDGTSEETECTGKQEVINVQPNKKYLLHILNAASLAYYNFAIADHKLTVIGADNSTLEHFTTDSVDINSGGRLRVILQTNSVVPAKNYKIRVMNQWRGTVTDNGGIGNAMLSYTGASAVSATEPPNEVFAYNNWLSRLKASSASQKQDPVPKKADKQILLKPIQQWTDMKTGKGLDPAIRSAKLGTKLAWTVYDNSRLVLPRSPYQLAQYVGKLDEIIAMGGSMSEQTASKPVRIEQGQVVDIVIQNTIATHGICEQHPWHLHGNEFFVVGFGAGQFDPFESPKKYNTVNPPRLDTTTVYPSAHSNVRGETSVPGTWKDSCGWLTIRFIAKQPGMHLFHCHIDWHMIMGMGMMFDVSSEKVGPPPDDYQLCGPIYSATLAEKKSSESAAAATKPVEVDCKVTVRALTGATICLGAVTIILIAVIMYLNTKRADDLNMLAAAHAVPLDRKKKIAPPAPAAVPPVADIPDQIPADSSGITQPSVRTPEAESRGAKTAEDHSTGNPMVANTV